MTRPTTRHECDRDCGRAPGSCNDCPYIIKPKIRGKWPMNNIFIARVCHEANRAYCQTIGDNTQAPWDEAPEWQRDSAIKGVEFCRSNPGAPPSANHESWLEVKHADGWRYGPVKIADKKEHPCCVPYEELPEEQKRKDALFKAVVDALA